MIGKACKQPRCPTIHNESGSYCAVHKPADTSWSGFRYAKKNPFYDRKPWLLTRARKLGLNPICEACNRVAATEVHHIVPLMQCVYGQEYALDNLRSMCKPCHAQETARESNEKMAANRKGLAIRR